MAKNLFTHKEKFYSTSLLSPPKLARPLARWCIGLFLVVLIIMFLPWTQNVDFKGQVTSLNPQNRPQTVQSTLAGRIERWYVQEGQKVEKGDTLVALSEIKEKFFDPNLLQRTQAQVEAKQHVLEANKQKATALNNQIGALRNGLNLSLSKAANKVLQMQYKTRSDSMDVVAARTDNSIAADQLARAEKMYSNGQLISLRDLEQRRLKMQESSAKLVSAENKLNSTRQELINARIELNSLQAEYLDKISKAESDLSSTLAYQYATEGEIAKMQSEYTSLQIRNSFYFITAPQDGYVVKAMKQGLGETIKEGEDLLSVMPSRMDKAVELYVKPMDLPLLTVGTHVRLQFDGWPALIFAGWPGASFGTFGGTIQAIDKIDSKGKYRILVVSDGSKEHPWPEQLQIGSGANGWALLNDVPIGYEIWRQLNGFPPDFIDHPNDGIEYKKDKKDGYAKE